MADIIQIGEWRLQHKHKYRYSEPGDCDHQHIELDARGDIVRCVKCGVQLSAFWALQMLSEEYNRALSKLQRDREALAKAKEAETHLLAARKVESVWRSRTVVPACPHCGIGILPEDGLGSFRINRKIELQRRAAAANNEKE